MGIARAIERVKQQAKRGGLNAVMAGLGEELRSTAIPAPLRGAAQRIAALFERERSSSDFARERPPANATPAPLRETVRANEPEPEAPPVTVRPELPLTAMDSGAEPAAPAVGEPVDAKRVGATPTYNATPVDATPLDATPVNAAPLEAAPVEIAPLNTKPVDESAGAKPVGAKPVDAKPVDGKSADARAVEETAATAEEERRVDPSALEETLARAAAPDEPSLSEALPSRVEASEPVVTAAVIEDVDDDDVRALDEDTREMDDEVTLVTPAQNSAVTVPAPAAPATSAPAPKAKSRSRGGQGGRKRAPGEAPRDEKEKLAADGEAAKTLARSNSRSAKKRPGAKGDTSKKK